MERLAYSELTEAILRMATAEQKRRGNTNLACGLIVRAAVEVMAAWKKSGETPYEEGKKLDQVLASDPEGVRSIIGNVENDLTLGNKEGDGIVFHDILIRANDRARELNRDALTADILVETVLEFGK